MNDCAACQGGSRGKTQHVRSHTLSLWAKLISSTFIPWSMCRAPPGISSAPVKKTCIGSLKPSCGRNTGDHIGESGTYVLW